MAWFNPKTWARGAGVPSDELNTYLRDNTLHLYQRLGPWRDGDGQVTDAQVREALGVDNDWSTAKDAASARTALGLSTQRELRPFSSRTIQGSILGSITPVGLCSFGNTVWVADGSRLIPVDATTFSVGSTVNLSRTPRGVATNGTYFWVASTGLRVIAHDASGARVPAQDAGANESYGAVAFGGGNLYAAGLSRGQDGIVLIDPGETSTDVRVSHSVIRNAIPGADASFTSMALATDGDTAWLGVSIAGVRDKLFAFSLSSGAYDPSNDVAISVPPNVIGATLNPDGTLYVIGEDESFGVQAYRFIQVVVIDG